MSLMLFSLGFGFLSGSTLAGNGRTRHFLVTAATGEYAQRVADQAEESRQTIAIEWLGAELPAWPDTCPITVRDDPGAGGATSFAFDTSGPRHWRMTVQGSQDRVLDSVIPHEVWHMVMASHLRQPVPRWADEGSAITVEHQTEQQRFADRVVEALSNRRGIPLRTLVSIRQYPRDAGRMVDFYAQGYSIVSYLLAQPHDQPKRQLTRFLAAGTRSGDWDAAVRTHYRIANLDELQIRWNRWLAKRVGRQVGQGNYGGVSLPAAAGKPSPAAAGLQLGRRPAPLRKPWDSDLEHALRQELYNRGSMPLEEWERRLQGTQP